MKKKLAAAVLAVAALLGAVAITVAAPTIAHADYSVRTLD
jgi:hypothetical protein